MTVLLAVQLCAAGPSRANDAQAGMVSRPAPPGYQMPEHLSPEEKKWFKVFQDGNILATGWQEISAEILARTPAEKWPEQKEALEHLGRKIGMEWCRPNRVRKVTSSMLQEWGDILRMTARKNPGQLPQALAYIDQRVNAALN